MKSRYREHPPWHAVTSLVARVPFQSALSETSRGAPEWGMVVRHTSILLFAAALALAAPNADVYHLALADCEMLYSDQKAICTWRAIHQRTVFH
jgi:hypothetical protein